MLQNVYRLASGVLPRLYLESGLFDGGVISGSGVDLHGRQPLGRVQLDFDFPPGAVVARIRWFISEDILVSQLGSDFGSNIAQIGELRYREHTPSRHFHEF